MLIMPLVVPILIATVALFFASFLAWMVLPLHKSDWLKMPNEEGVLAAIKAANVPPGNYMFPGVTNEAERATPEYQSKCAEGPFGVMTVFSGMTMGRNLGLTLLYFFVATCCLAYLARLGLPAGASFVDVFRFLSTASFLTFLGGIVPHSIWFRCRIAGHVIESLAYAAIVGGIFGWFWPGSF